MTTTGSLEEAEKIANTLVDERLAACVNILPKINSTYRWKGEVEKAEEVLLLAKTSEEELEEIIETIEKKPQLRDARSPSISFGGWSFGLS